MSLNLIGFDTWGYGPSVTAAKAANVNFRTWYTSFDGSKDGPASGPADYANGGIWNVTNFETTINRIFAGYQAGHDDMVHAINEYVPRGMPKGAVVILSADENINVNSFGQVLPYYQGAHDAAAGQYLTGCYGEQALIAYLKSHGVIQVGWKSMSSSFPGGGTEDLCDIVQTGGGSIGGVSIDWNVGKVAFFGQWKPGVLAGGSPGPVPTPTPVPAPGGHSTLALGASGSEVVQMQTELNKHGAKLVADGAFGPATLAALKAFQSVSGLTPDGVCGPLTWAKLDASVPAPPPVPVPTPPPTVPPFVHALIYSGAAVVFDAQAKIWQQKMHDRGWGLVVDGFYGPASKSAAQAFQIQVGLTADGIVGPLTWTATWTAQITTPTPPVGGSGTPGRISMSQIDFAGKGSYSSGPSACASYATQACAILGFPTAHWVPGMVTIAERESAYNSSNWQVNTTDSNAHGPTQADGAPLYCSRGGWQTIPPTFADNHAPGTSLRIYEPVANCASAMIYIMNRYGVSRDGSNLQNRVQQADPNRPPRGY